MKKNGEEKKHGGGDTATDAQSPGHGMAGACREGGALAVRVLGRRRAAQDR